MSLRVPTSSYAQLEARRRYHRRNRAALNLMRKMLHAGVRMSTAECREMIQKENQRVHRGES